MANTQNADINETIPKWQDMVKRCAEYGKDALIVKATDVLDSYKFYQAINDTDEIERSLGIGRFILKNIPSGVEDKIFDELKRIA